MHTHLVDHPANYAFNDQFYKQFCRIAESGPGQWSRLGRQGQSSSDRPNTRFAYSSDVCYTSSNVHIHHKMHLSSVCVPHFFFALCVCVCDFVLCSPSDFDCAREHQFRTPRYINIYTHIYAHTLRAPFRESVRSHRPSTSGLGPPKISDTHNWHCARSLRCAARP